MQLIAMAIRYDTGRKPKCGNLSAIAGWLLTMCVHACD